MAVSARLLTYPEETFTPQDFSIMLERVSIIKTGILHGCKVTALGTNSVKISEGWITVRGRLVKIENGTLDFSLPASGEVTKYVLLTVNLSNSAAPAKCEIADSVPADDEEFNFNDGSAYFSIAKITVSTTGISIVETPVIVDPNLEYKQTITMTVGGWNNGIYNFENDYPSSAFNVDIEPNGDVATVEQIKAWGKAIIAGSPSANKCKAFGKVPTIDIPIILTARYKKS